MIKFYRFTDLILFEIKYREAIPGIFSAKSCPSLHFWRFCYYKIIILFSIFLSIVPSAANQKSIQIPEKIVIASDDNYPPYIFRDENGKLTGYLIDIWNLWEKKTGTKVEWMATDWSKAISMMEAGNADILETVFFTIKRSTWLTFSKPYAEIPSPVYVHRKLTGISDISSLKGLTIGAKERDNVINVLMQNGITNIKTYPNYEAIIKDARDGNIKIFAIDEPPALFYIYKYNLENEFRQSVVLYTGAFHRAVRKGNESLLNYIEKGFSLITEKENKAILDKWMGKPLFNPVYIKYIYYAIIAILVIIATLVMFNYILRKQIKIKTNQLNEAYKNLLKAEDRWKFAIEGTEQGLWDWNIKTGEVYFSPQWKKMLGFNEDEIGNSINEWESRVHPDDIKAAWEDIRKHFNGETDTYINEHRLKCKDGTYKWIIDRGKIIDTDENGAPLRMIGTHTDITLHKENEKLLQEKEALYRFLFEHNPAPMLVYEWGTLNILAVNEAFTNRYGYNKEEIRNMVLTDLCPDNEKESIKNLTSKISGYAFAGEWHHIKKDGSIITILAHSHDLVYDGKEARVIVITDITYLKEIEEEIIKARNKAEESDKLKTAFLANMSHEIRTPMNAILGFMQLLKNPLLDQEERANYVEIIEKNGERLLSTINNIIEISRIETGLVEVKMENVSVSEIIQNIIKLFRYQAEEKGIKLEFINGKDPVPLEIITDRFKLETILINLIGNAIKFTEKGFVETGYNIKKDIVEFYVKDSGLGIPPEKIETIFKPFVQVENDLNRSYEGSGLGLAIAKAYIELLGGTIKVESEPGNGTVFYFTVPYIEKGNIKTAGNKTVTEMPSSFTPNLPLKILVAEDDEASYLFIKTILSGYGLTILRAMNGEEAIGILKTNPEISLLLLDIKMPVMDGLKATRLIREFNKTIPIIAQTALVFPFDMEQAIEAGCTDYITKPIDRREMIGKVQKYLSF